MSDVYQQPILARDGQAAATPTLVKQSPLPMHRHTGSLAGTTCLMMDLVPRGKTGR